MSNEKPRTNVDASLREENGSDTLTDVFFIFISWDLNIIVLKSVFLSLVIATVIVQQLNWGLLILCMAFVIFNLLLEILSGFDASLREMSATNNLLEMDLKIKISSWLVLLRTTSGQMYWKKFL